MQVSVFDRIEITDRRRTGDGFLATKGRISKTGLYEYRKGEVGAEGNPNDIVKIYRSEDAVFSDESMGAFAHRPITLNHPPVMVDASNWKQYAVGQSGSKVRRDGEFVEVDMLLLDGAAISAVEGGAMISPGYVATVEMTPGQTPNGEHFDGQMVGPFRGNHIAVLTGRGRGGPECRLGDAWPVEDAGKTTPEKEKRNVKTYTLDGLPVRFDDEAAIEAAFVKLTDKAAAAETALATALTDKATAEAATATAATAHATAIEAKDAEIATLTATNATLTTELADARDPAKLRDAAAEYAAVVAKATALGATVTDADSAATVKRNAVNAKLGDVAKDWTDAQVDVSFATLSAGVKDAEPDAFRKAMADRDPIATGDVAAKAKSARDKMIADMIAPRSDAK